MKYFKLSIVLIALLFLSSCGDIETSVDAKMKVLGSRRVKIAGITVLSYSGLHKNIGVSFDIGGVKFVEQLRVPIVVVEQYKDTGSIPLRVVFSGNHYTVHCDSSDGIALTRRLSRVKSKTIKDYLKNERL